MIGRLLMVAALVGGTASRGASQAVEVAPFVGYRIGGHFQGIGTTYDIGDHVSFGGTVGLNLRRDLDVEFLFTRESSDATATSAGAVPTSFGVSVTHLMAGASKTFRAGRPGLRPKANLLVGISRFQGDRPDSDSRYWATLAAGAGAKYFLTPNVALGLDARGYLILTNGGDGFLCTDGFSCIVSFPDVMPQGELAFSVIVGLGTSSR